MKKQITSILLVISFVCCLLSGCEKKDLGKGYLEDSSAYSADDAFDTLSHQWFVSQMSEDPLSCHFSISNPSSYGISFGEGSYSDLS